MEDEFELIDEEDFADAPLDVSGDVPAAPSRSLFSCTLAAITPQTKVVVAAAPRSCSGCCC